MFWLKKIKSAEYKSLDERVRDLYRKLDILDIEFSALTDKVIRAIARKALKKVDEPETKENISPQILPI